MHTPLERLVRRLTVTERMATLVGALVIAAMLSAITLDRLLTNSAPIVVTVTPSTSTLSNFPSSDKSAAINSSH